MPTRAKPTPIENTVSPKREEEPTPTELAQQVFGDDIVKRPVIVKLARIMADLPKLEPEGRNQHFGYNFIKDTQVSGALRSRLAAVHLMIIPDVVEESWVEVKTARGGTSYVTKMKIYFTVIDGDTGDSVGGHGYGYGDDSGDKGANKAFTAALKYWLLKLFQIGGEDAESDSQADLRAADRQAGSAAEGGVTVQGAKIEGVARGGHSDTITRAQATQLLSLYRDLELTPDGLVLRVESILGIVWVLGEDGDPTVQLNQLVRGLTSDQAGQLISGMVDEKDARGDDDGSSPYGS